jgi:lipoprotein-anchoring transpeptidase ErfK/SrfK
MTNVRRAVVMCFVAAVALVGVGNSPAGAQDGVVPARIDVSIKLQRAYVYGSDGSLMREIPISSGRGGRTPLGRFAVTTRSEWTTATSDPKVRMQWMTRFNGGIGFHGIPRKGTTALSTPLGQRAVSHGCIRMSDQDARYIYQWVPRGTPVNVIPK